MYLKKNLKTTYKIQVLLLKSISLLHKNKPIPRSLKKQYFKDIKNTWNAICCYLTVPESYFMTEQPFENGTFLAAPLLSGGGSNQFMGDEAESTLWDASRKTSNTKSKYRRGIIAKDNKIRKT